MADYVTPRYRLNFSVCRYESDIHSSKYGSVAKSELLDLTVYFDYSGNMKTNDAVKALGALAQESRLEIFRLLVRKGAEGIAAGDLSSHFKMPPATMSFHLKELSNAGLIASRRESRSIIYAANYGHMQELLDFLMENCCADNGGKC
jgi:ArsR family transcriptional regulator